MKLLGTFAVAFSLMISLTTTAFAAASPSGTRLTAPTTASFTDGSGKVYTIVGGVIAQNGVLDKRTSTVSLLLYYNGLIYQQITKGAWWSTTGAAWPLSVWTALSGDPRVISASGTTVPSATSIVDSAKNIYVTVGGQIVKNGITDTRTSTVKLLLYYNGLIYQQITKGAWWSTTGANWPTSVWTVVASDPRSPTPSPSPSASPKPSPSPSASPKPSPSPSPSATPVPPGAMSAGYIKAVFNSDFTKLPTPTASSTSQQILTNAKLVDTANSQVSGFSWYTTCWFCSTHVAPTSLSVVNDNGTHALRIDGGASNSLYQEERGAHGVVGNQYSHGAYFEAKIAMALAANGAKAWPTFWALPHMDGGSIAWPGSSPIDCSGVATTFTDSVEMDIMELLPLEELGVTVPTAGASIHDWYGAKNCTCAKNDCQNTASFHAAQSADLPLTSSPTDPVFNTFGLLWVPGTATAQGYVQFYYNDVPFGAQVPWTGGPPSAVNPTNLNSDAELTVWPSSLIPDWAFGVIDNDPFSLVLSTGGGAFMDVQYVRVWQK